MLISVKYLPRDLRIIGVIALVFAFLQIPGIARASIFLIQSTIYLSSGIVLFSLASGVSKKEKWAWVAGITTFIFSIASGIISLLSGWTSPFYFIISLLIPALFLITFIRGKAEITISSKFSLTPLSFWIVGFTLLLGSWFYLIISII